MKNVKLLMILIILLMVLVGCPNDNAAQTENTGTAVQNKITSLQAVIDSDDTKSGDTIDLSQYSDITNYSANINKALTINGAGKDFGQAVITADVDGIGLSGMQNVGTLTASASLGNGSLKISGSSLSNLNILGGGSHSVYIEDHTNIGILTVDKILTPQSDEPVRLVLDDTVKIGKIIVKSGLFVDATDDMSVEIGNVIFDVSGDSAAVIAISRRVTADQTTDAASVNVTIRDEDIPQASITMLCAEDTIIPTEFVTAAFETLVAPLSADGLISLQDKLSAGLSVPLTEDAVIAVEGLVDSCGTVHRVIIENMQGSGILPNVIDLTSDYKLPVPENQGMVFIGWSLIIDDATSDQTIDTLCASDDYSGAIILYARWTAGTVAYTVKRLFQKVTGDEYESLSEYSDLIKSGIADTTTDVTADSITGFTAVGIEQQKITADGSTVAVVRYNRNVVTYTFDAAGGLWDGDTDTTTVSGRFGAYVTLPANPTRAGYTFSGWSPAVPQTFGAVPASYTAQWTIKHYTVKFMNGDNVYTTQDVTYDCTVSAPETDPIKQATDTARYTFAYWYAEGQDNGYDFNTPITAPLTLHAKWNETPLYKVTIGSVTNGTVTADKTSGIEAGETVTLAVVPNSGYFRDDLSVTDSSGVVVTVTDNKFKMPASNVTVTATFTTEVTYRQASLSGSTVTYTTKVVTSGNFTTLESSSTSWTSGKWYVVSKDVTITEFITVSGTANIILCDGATLTAKMGITVESGNTLNIYAQSGDTGKLVAGVNIGGYSRAGIGGKVNIDGDTACGTVIIHGGVITATGGDTVPGIGGGASGGTVTIYGGVVTAVGGQSGAGIGGNPGGNVAIYGGNVTASGSDGYMGHGAGIGGNAGADSHGTLTVGSGLTVYAGDSSPGSQTTAAAYSDSRSAYVHIYK